MAEPDWDYRHAYPGGPMVPVPGFPRCLYPPDAAPRHMASANGPDVEAYKRTVSRAGRWPWQQFDEAYSNAFAHGKEGGNVSDSGIAGVQRQNGVEPTGWIGEPTFNLLRSIRIPEGLPHAGEPAMDATAQNLIALAYQEFAMEPPYAPQTIREQALAEAVKWLGYQETPAGSNHTTFGAWYGLDYQPWCAMFVTFCFECGVKGGSPSFAQGSRYSYVPYVVADAQEKWNGLSVTDAPIPGDLVCYDWDGGAYDHIGLFNSGDAGLFTAIEGNTSPDDYGSQSNGGEVCLKTRSVHDAHSIVFVRVEEP